MRLLNVCFSASTTLNGADMIGNSSASQQIWDSAYRSTTVRAAMSARYQFLMRNAMYGAAYAAARRLSVCPSHAGILSKQLNKSSNIFSPSGSHTVLVFPYQSLWQYSDGYPHNGGGGRMQGI